MDILAHMLWTNYGARAVNKKLEKKKGPLISLGWALHILIDIPSHAATFYPTPFLFPISNYRFTHGISWSNKWFMIINYSLLLLVSLYFFNRKKYTA
jgi:hypothetical protein